MHEQTDTILSLLNSAYTFQSVSGKNADFAQSVQGTPFYFRSVCADSSCALSVHAGGEIRYSVPVRFHQAPLPYTLLLFVTEGDGTLSFTGESLTLTSNDILLVSPDTDCRFDTAHTPFSYYAFYLSGSITHDYLSLLCEKQLYHKENISKTSPILPVLLPAVLKLLPSGEYTASLHLSAIFHLIFSALLDACGNNEKTAVLPEHVLRMKQIYDSGYPSSHSLESLENEIGISRYRLCRDFSMHIGVSPVQYLNQVRLSHARRLLLTTSLTIREVGLSVGIENTTHFINLFKKSAGITPLQFRQNHKL